MENKTKKFKIGDLVKLRYQDQPNMFGVITELEAVQESSQDSICLIEFTSEDEIEARWVYTTEITSLEATNDS